MPTLNWIGKEAVANHHLQVPLHLLKDVPELACGQPGDGNSPLIREWLGKVVGKEGETLDRHDRWLCVMYPRPLLLKRFLRPDGSIWVSMDDSEIALLRAASKLSRGRPGMGIAQRGAMRIRDAHRG